MSRRTQKAQAPRSRGNAGLTLKTRAKSSAAASVARERRLRAIDTEVKRAVTDNPRAGKRLGAYLAGEIPDPKQDRSVTVRLPAALIERIEALVPFVKNDPAVTAARGGGSGVGISAVVRLALIEGLAVLELKQTSR